MRHLPPLIAALALLMGGAVGYISDETVVGIALLSAGLVVLGVWIAVEVRKNQDDIPLTREDTK
jgi:TRAP-type uncharacterized transport system fused permease subunit